MISRIAPALCLLLASAAQPASAENRTPDIHLALSRADFRALSLALAAAPPRSIPGDLRDKLQAQIDAQGGLVWDCVSPAGAIAEVVPASCPEGGQ